MYHVSLAEEARIALAEHQNECEEYRWTGNPCRLCEGLEAEAVEAEEVETLTPPAPRAPWVLAALERRLAPSAFGASAYSGTR